MSDCLWEITAENTLSCTRDNRVAELSALDIIKAEYGSSSYSKPSDQIPNLKINRFPLNPKLYIIPHRYNESLYISGKICYSNQLGTFEITKQTLLSDQVTQEFEWYPIILDNVEAIRTILSECQIDSLLNITLQSYLKIIRHKDPDNLLFIQDIVEEDIDGSPIKISTDHTGLKGNLYDYQRIGYNWLSRISQENFGCILADEMGLGKTLQIIALINTNVRNSDTTSLIICPSSLLENWRREFEKFTPEISTYIHSGSSRTGFREILETFDVIITSYDIAVIDKFFLETINWNFIVCDEAQNLKNPDSKRSRYIKELNSRVTIAVTGTPFENRLMDIWSLFDLITPGLLGSMSQFTNEFPESVQSAEKLEPVISPLILRRMVSEVADDLPDKVYITQPVGMSEELVSYYDEFRNEIIREYGKNATFVSLIKLRMFCCDPALVLDDGINYDGINQKYQRLIEILFEIYKSGEKGLIFTSFTKICDKIVSMIVDKLNCFVDYIDGRVKIEDRQNIIDSFSSTVGSGFLVLNPKAAGTGLNITAANHVIHYNLEWNPSVEDQATARAYRRGQDKPVFVYRLYYNDTVEEYIDGVIDRKRSISEKSVVGISGGDNEFIDIYSALQFTPNNKT